MAANLDNPASLVSEEQKEWIKKRTHALLKALSTEPVTKGFGEEDDQAARDSALELINQYYSDLRKYCAQLGMQTLNDRCFAPALELFESYYESSRFDLIRAAFLYADTLNGQKAGGWLRQDDALSKRLFSSRFWHKDIERQEAISRMRAIFEMAFCDEKVRNTCKARIQSTNAQSFYKVFVENINGLFFPLNHALFQFQNPKEKKDVNSKNEQPQEDWRKLLGAEIERGLIAEAKNEADWWLRKGEDEKIIAEGAEEVVQGARFISAIQESFNSDASDSISMKVTAESAESQINKNFMCDDGTPKSKTEEVEHEKEKSLGSLFIEHFEKMSPQEKIICGVAIGIVAVTALAALFVFCPPAGAVAAMVGTKIAAGVGGFFSTQPIVASLCTVAAAVELGVVVGGSVKIYQLQH